MTNEALIETSKFCNCHQVEIKFIDELHEFGIIEITEIEQTRYFPAEQLPEIEKMLRLYADLGINMEGLAAIRHLLQKMENMQAEISRLKSQLYLFEE